MGLVFTVGRPACVFDDPVAELMAHVLDAECGEHLAPDGGEAEPFHSGELGWSGWGLLQERARGVVAPEEIHNLLSMEAWHGAFLPGWPHDTRFLTEQEKQMAQYRVLCSNGGREEAIGGTWDGVKDAAKDPFTWYFCLMHFALVTAQSFKDFLPSVCFGQIASS